jgi:poly(3-hydroxybutyrate) depolymerase
MKGPGPVSFYQLYEFNHAALSPFRAAADAARLYFQNPLNPFSHTPFGRSVAAAAELFERTTRRYGKPDWGIADTSVRGVRVPVSIETVWERPFCNLLHFRKAGSENQQKLVIVAPLSGHYATLLRGTVQTMLPDHDVYITEWVDARMVPLAGGKFDLDDYIDYVISILHTLGAGAHLMAVCQPSVPVLAAVALMSTRNDRHLPATMTLMGGPIDTRINPTQVNVLATTREFEWFERNVITSVPLRYPGAFRRVYPGFLQLAGFMQMNLDRHVTAHVELFHHLVKGDGESAEATQKFYDEYTAVMDLPAEFYLQTIREVFQLHSLPLGKYVSRDRKVEPKAIKQTALLTVEGENDDICAVGQTSAAHALCTGLPVSKKAQHLQPKVGHYGVFNGRRWSTEIYPVVRDFIRTHG